MGSWGVVSGDLCSTIPSCLASSSESPCVFPKSLWMRVMSTRRCSDISPSQEHTPVPGPSGSSGPEGVPLVQWGPGSPLLTIWDTEKMFLRVSTAAVSWVCCTTASFILDVLDALGGWCGCSTSSLCWRWPGTAGCLWHHPVHFGAGSGPCGTPYSTLSNHDWIATCSVTSTDAFLQASLLRFPSSLPCWSRHRSIPATFWISVATSSWSVSFMVKKQAESATLPRVRATICLGTATRRLTGSV